MGCGSSSSTAEGSTTAHSTQYKKKEQPILPRRQATTSLPDVVGQLGTVQQPAGLLGFVLPSSETCTPCDSPFETPRASTPDAERLSPVMNLINGTPVAKPAFAITTECDDDEASSFTSHWPSQNPLQPPTVSHGLSTIPSPPPRASPVGKDQRMFDAAAAFTGIVEPKFTPNSSICESLEPPKSATGVATTEPTDPLWWTEFVRRAEDETDVQFSTDDAVLCSHFIPSSKRLVHRVAEWQTSCQNPFVH